MRIHSAILAGIAALLAACGISAAPIPSGASGWYAAPDRLCRVVLSREADGIIVDLTCVQDATGQPTYSRSRADAFGYSCVDNLTVAFHNQDIVGSGHVALDSFDGSTLSVRVAPDPLQLHQGGGSPQLWPLIRPVASPLPYLCVQTPAPPAPIDPRSRDLVCRINPSSPYCRP